MALRISLKQQEWNYDMRILQLITLSELGGAQSVVINLANSLCPLLGGNISSITVGQGLAVERVAHICHPRTDVVAVLGLQIRLSIMGHALQSSHPVVLVSDEGYGCVPVQ